MSILAFPPRDLFLDPEPLAPLHATHATEPTPLFDELTARRNAKRLHPAGRRHLRAVTHIPVCRPSDVRLAVLNDGTGVTGALLWNL